jgi:light-regulated signal transduction histidine kinase (bacteriophytochrome)
MFTEQQQRAGISAETRDGKVVLTVWNNSVVLDSKILDHLFLPYVQENHASGSAAPLLEEDCGFFLIKKITELNNGTFSVENTENRRNVFTMVFPIVDR